MTPQSLSGKLRWIAGVTLAVAMPAPGTSAQEAAPRPLRVLVNAVENPAMFNLQGSGEPGFERELIEGFARLHKRRIEIATRERFGDLIPALLANDGDVITGIIDTPERRNRITFTSEVLPARHIVVSYAPRPGVGSLEEFRRLRVGSVTGTSWWRATIGAGIPEAAIVAFPDAPSMLQALREGRVEAAIMSLSDFTLAAKADPALRAGVQVGEPASAAWGVRQDDTALRTQLDEYIANVRHTPTWSRLIVKYFGEAALKVLGRD